MASQPSEHEVKPPVQEPSGSGRGLVVPIGQLVLAVVGVYVAVESRSLGLWTTLGPGPGLLPLILGLALLGLTAVWVGQTVVERRRSTEGLEAVPADGDAAPEERLDRTYVIGVVGGLILLAALMEVLGFQIAMATFLFAELWLLGRQRWWIAASVAIIGSVGIYVLFDRVLAVQLPLSSLPFLSSLGL
jgi:hypothetical protein